MERSDDVDGGKGEGKISGLFLEELADVAVYQEAMARLLRVALNPSESVDFIDRISKELP
ncbi:Scr1 family TA system antitoxin-like transcriptional regulator [Nocardiopsis sediminis]|uniref:Scr1 family TA system antitoxin-like transcriptional regulator n=1 Tax=Nocardiopsis sediminis TaxID=1778267 RepID=A0ABV8FT64_9ACTN